MIWLKAPNISCKHGFSTRRGGISLAPFDSMNLGGSEDDPSHISKNRELALHELGLENFPVARLKQVHGNDVHYAQSELQTGDAHVTDKAGLTLAINIADCYPLLFHDPINRIIGAAHAGWRGTVARIGTRTIAAMKELGADIKNIHVAIGQGICAAKFEVGPEVLLQFKEQGFPESCFAGNHIDLLEANRFVLLESDISPANIWAMNRCTTEPDFFSYRRDHGKTGRMWAVICL
jgi:polyphenol oxidase